jgi:hypothetical protein
VTAPGPAPSPARRPVHYRRRRRPLPAIALIVVLAAVATIVWIRTLESADKKPDTACNPPAAGAATTAVSGQPAADRGTLLPPDALNSVEPLPPDAVKVRVLNANGQRGQAGLVAAQLTSDLGFTKAGEPGNDPVYPAWDMSCLGQIRFGANGDAAARTLSLVVPCAELVRDARPDDTVDLALGQKFEELRPTSAAKEVLRRLTELAARPTDPNGGQQAAPATVDPALIASAREVTC